MDINTFIASLFTPAGFSKILQLLIIVLEVLYVFYAFVVVRQVKLMTKSVQTQLGFLFSVGAMFLFLGSLAIAAFSILAL